MKRTAAITAILKERFRQDQKWGTRFPGRSHDRWLTILAEEFGEAAEAILQSDNPNGDEKLEDVRKEVIQIAAVALSWLEYGEWGEEEGEDLWNWVIIVGDAQLVWGPYSHEEVTSVAQDYILHDVYQIRRIHSPDFIRYFLDGR